MVFAAASPWGCIGLFVGRCGNIKRRQSPSIVPVVRDDRWDEDVSVCVSLVASLIELRNLPSSERRLDQVPCMPRPRPQGLGLLGFRIESPGLRCGQLGLVHHQAVTL